MRFRRIRKKVVTLWVRALLKSDAANHKAIADGAAEDDAADQKSTCFSKGLKKGLLMSVSKMSSGSASSSAAVMLATSAALTPKKAGTSAKDKGLQSAKAALLSLYSGTSTG